MVRWLNVVNLSSGEHESRGSLGRGRVARSDVVSFGHFARFSFSTDLILSTLIFAAMDTTSSALSRTLSLLVQHSDVQERLRAEIRAAKKDLDVLSYDQLDSLPYLDAVCRETLRLCVSSVC